MQKTKILLYIIVGVFFTSQSWCQNLHLQVTGNNKQESKVIDSLDYLKTHGDYASLLSEIDTIQKKLLKIGYIENEQKTVQINDSTYRAAFHLKKQYKHVVVYYDQNVVPEATIKTVSKQVFDSYFVLPIESIESALNAINSKQTEQGFPFSKLKLSNIAVNDTDTLTAHLTIDNYENKRVINAIQIKGYTKFPKSYLKHYLKIKPSQLFDLSALRKKTAQLNNLRFANQIKAPEVLFTKDSTTIYIYVEKTKSNTFDGFLGFGTNEQTNKLDFNGYLNLNLVNNLNYGEAFALQYKSTQNQQKRFEAHLMLPYLFNTPIGVDFQLHIFKQDSTFTTVDQMAKLRYQVDARNTVFAGIKGTQSNNLLNNTSSGGIADYNSNFATLGYEFTKVQPYNLLFPIKTNIYAESGFGKRRHTDTSEKQTMLNFDAFKIINLNRKNSLYIRLNANSLISNTFFENELSRFGGINSIRGFEENSLLATSYGLINTEYRLQLNNTLYIHTITDIALLDNKITKTNEKLYGFGFGIGLLSKAGLFKLNYAAGKSDNQKFKFSNSKVHLSLIANF